MYEIQFEELNPIHFRIPHKQSFLVLDRKSLVKILTITNVEPDTQHNYS